MYTVSKFAQLVGVTVKTLQRWDREGKLKALRTSTNRRYYTDKHLNEVLSRPETPKKTVCYCRVSSQTQRNDLKNQREVLEQFLATKGIANAEFISEIGGGLNFSRPLFLNLIFDILDHRVDRLIVAHKDRLARFGFDLIKSLCDKVGCELLVLSQERLSPEQEMVQDLLSIVHCFSSRLYGLRNYKRELKKVIASNADPKSQNTTEA